MADGFKLSEPRRIRISVSLFKIPNENNRIKEVSKFQIYRQFFYMLKTAQSFTIVNQLNT